ncbi:MAG: putative transporter integral rane protein [Blastococcus sp.]|jgi:putative ABC transport system permease protein|nr:putative transporter integral rane protein [Blastococcus sp.]
MLKVSLRNVLANKLRLFLTVAAVTVGVAFVSGTFVLSDTMSKAFDQLFTGLTSGTDVVVRGQSAYTTGAGSQAQPRPLDQDVVGEIERVPGVAAAQGSVTGFALILDQDGAPIQPGGAPTLGSSVGGDEELAGAIGFREGRAPSGPDEVAIDAGSAGKAGYEVGDAVDIVFEGGRDSFTVVGVVGFGTTDSLAGATLAGFDLPTAQQLLGKVGVVDQIDARAADGVPAGQLRAAIAGVLPADVEALTAGQVADESSAAVRDGTAVFSQVLLVFAGVSVLVGSFVIWNTFSVLVAQRRREVALLRAVGASRRQVLAGIMVEAGLIGLVSAGVGLLAGVGLAVGIRNLLKVIGIEVPTTSAVIGSRTVVAALLVGVVVTMVAASVPAWAASRAAPIEALREAVPTAAGIGTGRRIAGWLLLTAGMAGLIVCAVVGSRPALTALATLTAFAGLLTAGPSLAGGMARLADHGRPGGGWRMAARNIARTPRRAAATALALTIGLTVVCAVAVTASSMKASVADSVTGGNRSDFALQPAGAGFGISPAAADVVRGLDDVDTVEELRYTSALVQGGDETVVGVDPDGLDEVVELGLQDDTLAAFTPGTMLLREKAAEALGLTAGDPVRITYPETGEQTLTLAGTFPQDSLLESDFLVALVDFEDNVTSRLDGAVLVSVRDGASLAAVERALTRALREYPNVTISDPAQLTADAQASVDQLLGIVTALLLLAVVVAVLGIVNTLVLSVVERTRELGLLRALGATRSQIRTLVRRESVLMSLLGAITGIALGTVSGIALSRALLDQGVTRLAVPTGTLAAYLGTAVLVGVLAAIGPARRASRIDVLRAVTTE